MHDSPRAKEKQQPWARPCDQHFVVLEGTTGVGFDVELLGRAVFFKDKTSSAIKNVSMPNDAKLTCSVMQLWTGPE